jgi:phosphate transport system substrate-binding protein
MRYSMPFILTTVLLFYSCGPSGVQKISIRGSDTEVNLVLQLSESFMANHDLVSIGVTGGGSGTGIASLIDGKTDIANSSRVMSKEEYALAREKGVEPNEVIFALDAIAVITHPHLGIDSLSLKDIGAIFRGDITNWREVGGPDMAISLYGRQSNSGTFTYFREAVLHDEYSSQMKQMNGTAQIIEAIKQDKAGIGYVGVGYLMKGGKPLGDVWAIRLYNGLSNAMSPYELEKVKQGEYFLTRPLFQYVNGVPDGILMEFIRFELSDAGQRIIAANGYIPLGEVQQEINARNGFE